MSPMLSLLVKGLLFTTKLRRVGDWSVFKVIKCHISFETHGQPFYPISGSLICDTAVNRSIFGYIFSTAIAWKTKI